MQNKKATILWAPAMANISPPRTFRQYKACNGSLRDSWLAGRSITIILPAYTRWRWLAFATSIAVVTESSLLNIWPRVVFYWSQFLDTKGNFIIECWHGSFSPHSSKRKPDHKVNFFLVMTWLAACCILHVFFINNHRSQILFNHSQKSKGNYDSILYTITSDCLFFAFFC